MAKILKRISASEFNGLAGIEYFGFEEDFIEKNIRCIPMIVRFKLDKVGIKLKLDEWNRLVVEERIELACRSCSNEEETIKYRLYLSGLIKKRSNREATDLAIDRNPGWADINKIPDLLLDKLIEDGLYVSLKQWKALTNLQRFVLLKLCRPGHESKNFPKALREFGLTATYTRFRGEKQAYEITGYHKD
ncbi:nitrate reductase associated protein [Flavitalea sp.]|nr:nitrate reductase associated protein [Flavitalea sp.]